MSTGPPTGLPTRSPHASVETSGVIPSLPGSDDDAGSGPAVRSLFTALVDDAAIFPPGNAPVDRAVLDHLSHKESWYGDIVGPFLVRASEIPVSALQEPGADLDVAVVADATSGDSLGGALTGLRALRALPRFRIVALEVPLPPDAAPGAAAADLVARVGRELPRDVRCWVEVPRTPGWREAVSVVAAAGDDVGVKVRTGGVDAAAFPSARELADVVRHVVDVEATFKLTAGLHTAVRGPDAATGAVHHGLLNIIGAVRAALNGAEADEVAVVLSETSAARLASAVRRMSEADVAVLRAFFASFGCCGVTDPVEDLVSLGLLDEVHA